MAKKMKRKTLIIPIAAASVLSIGLIVGTSIAYNYADLIDVFLTRSNYSASNDAKQLCEDVVGEGLVLLKNEDKALPLSASEKSVALYGQDSVDFVYGGSGSGSVDTSMAPNLKQAFEDAGFTVNQTLWDFYSTGPGKGYRKQTPDEAGHGTFAVNEVPQSVFTSEVKNSLKEDVGVVVFGRSGGESADLPTAPLASGAKYLQLDQNEKDTLALACSKHSKVIVVINANNPLELGFLEDPAYAKVKAAIWVGGVGQEGIRAIPKAIKGTINPSGRLVDTYAYDSTSAPSYVNLANNVIANSSVDKGREYLVFAEGIYIGYRYYETRYEDFVLGNTSGFDYASTVQFPFGYGLHYSDFSWSEFTVKEGADGKSYDLSLNVKNVGEVAGKDVVEFYVQKPYTAGGAETSAIELIEFGKTPLLKAGEDVTVTANVLKKDLCSYDYQDAKTYVLNAGEFYFTAGRNAHDAINNVLSAKGKTTANGMTANGNATLAKLAFNNPSVDKTSYAKSNATGKDIANALDEANLTKYDASFSYLSRSNWTATFPTRYQGGSWTAPESLLEDLKFYDISKDASDDAAVAAHKYAPNSSSTTHKVQDMIGVKKDDARWDELVAQLSYAQQTRLIRLGGYSTQQLDRIGLPSTQDKDGPSGISGGLVGGVSAMAWPAEVVMASTWNKDLIEKVGERFGQDSIEVGVCGVYGPGANIHRSPYSGRNFEYFSEDGCLSYQIAAHEVKGLRSKGVITYTKHFALNDQETNRYGAAIFANEQAIREILLKGFEGAIVEGKSNALMVAMNRVGARWAGANKGLMTNILREEWGFEGFAITDQASVPAMFYQDMVSGLWAGTDMWLNTNNSYWSMEGHQDNPTVKYYVHKAVKNIVYAITDSWAVNASYKTTTGGGEASSTAYVIPWRAILWTGDAIIWAGTIALSVILSIKFVKSRKAEAE